MMMIMTFYNLLQSGQLLRFHILYENFLIFLNLMDHFSAKGMDITKLTKIEHKCFKLNMKIEYKFDTFFV